MDLGNSGLSALTNLTGAGLNNLGTINLWSNETLGTAEQATFDDTRRRAAAATSLTYAGGVLGAFNGATQIAAPHFSRASRPGALFVKSRVSLRRRPH